MIFESIFKDKLLVDDREPWYWRTFDGGNNNALRVGFLPPKSEFFVQIVAIITFQIVLANALAILVYYGIVKSKNSIHISSSLLVGFGIIIPTSLLFPFLAMHTFDIQSTVLRMGLCALPLTVTFRTLQAMSGFTPAHFTKSLHNFRCHFGYLYHPKLVLDDDTTQQIIVPATLSYILTILLRYLTWNLSMAAIYSVLISLDCDYEPFNTNYDSSTLHVVLTDAAHLTNTFIAAMILSMSLSLSMNGIAPIVAVLGGFQVLAIMNHPLTCSTSPSDFWGRRWNTMVHTDLKNAIYLPTMNYTSSRKLAILATFIMSGLIHEYVWYVLFYCDNNSSAVCYTPHYGKNLLFFGWNGVLLLLEYMVGGRTMAWKLCKRLPRIVITIVVIFMALPLGHYMTGDLVQGGYIPQMSVAFPLLIIRRQG